MRRPKRRAPRCQRHAANAGNTGEAEDHREADLREVDGPANLVVVWMRRLTVEEALAKEPYPRHRGRCFAEYMRIHALESSGGNSYAQMGRVVAAVDPSDPKGTSDEAAAARDESGKPIPNDARNTWVTETAL